MKPAAKLTVVPSGPDPLLAARTEVATKTEAARVAYEKRIATGLEEERLRSLEPPDLDAIGRAKIAHELAAEKHNELSDKAEAAKARLASLEQGERDRKYQAAKAKAGDAMRAIWPLIAEAVAEDEQRQKPLIDRIVDAVVAHHEDHAIAADLEPGANVMFGMAHDDVRRLELSDVRYLVRVATALNREAKGYEIPGSWLEAEPKPSFGKPGYEEWERAVALLQKGKQQ